MSTTSSIRNVSTQGLEIILSTRKGYEHFWISPKETLIVQDSMITNTIRELARKRLIKINSN